MDPQGAAAGPSAGGSPGPSAPTVLRRAGPRIELPAPRDVEHPELWRLGGFYADVPAAITAAELLDTPAVAIVGPGRGGYWLEPHNTTR